MKTTINTIKTLAIVVLLLVSCEDRDTGEQNFVDEARGWIQFPVSNPDVIIINTPSIFQLGVSVQVPVTDSDLEISYRLVQVSGPDPNTVFSNNGKITVPAGVTSWAGPGEDNNTNNAQILPPIRFNIAEVPALTPMTFDVVLTATNSDKISVGIGNDFPLVQRLSIPCFNPDITPSDYFVGDYTLVNVDGTIGPANGTINIDEGPVTLTIDPSDPNSRTFMTPVFGIINPSPQPFKITFSSETNQVAINGDISPGVTCQAGGVPPLWIITNQPEGSNSIWDVCNDESILIRYIEDPLSSCGGPFNSSFMLTKL